MSDLSSPRNPPLNLTFINAPDAEGAQAQAQLQAALTQPVPRFYVNGIALAYTASDLIVTAMWNGAPALVMNIAIPTAKGVAEDLAKAVAQYERQTEQTIKTVGEIIATMQRTAGVANVADPGASS